MLGENEDSGEFEVVVNHEEQYSIWPADRAVPDGWRTAGQRGAKRACLEWIDANWTDMRPLSLREALRGAGDRA
ncbi:MbtH family NRPS accessory protein [Actinosynnema pretiosum subsp. pretiosum]|uniref:MbtH domain protein n=3 Tax=Actinomycetes TaxID=1760 RepID=C6WLN3_ACTMD|nr:MbtH family NRPS accessory protein [Actinosynnema mirum]AAT09800.1 NocI [Nocardia uniformis subsp. tsuyamanensis]ACU38426.1 MbtH domain protein [Actinosynnema mirum DSM 43827]AXX31971.1 putative MbtH-like protein [Actinosynnema pretiosum subsp. pretiosum]QUF04050.1 MbtH family NRPS accessory protein [Actinosynnema pretiosum subsp. pretiosum]